jgi:hypothetical protein
MQKEIQNVVGEDIFIAPKYADRIALDAMNRQTRELVPAD